MIFKNLNPLFQKPGLRSGKKCPFSGPDAPVIDYKNVKLLKSYISENGKNFPLANNFGITKKTKVVIKIN
ncbi:MAG: hypothetical protein CM1200mP13_14480 [Candidatus Pelagibacterales bacterium]|nr:MAG: hypothetical protein CM1200mP13_14480 [Pelagibacterales bacterium]